MVLIHSILIAILDHILNKEDKYGYNLAIILIKKF